MKNLILFILLALAIVTSCKKTDKQSRNLTESTFPGSYRWVLTTGGIYEHHLTPATEGYNMTYTFNSDSTLIIVQGSNSNSQHYSVGTGNSITFSTSAEKFTYNHHQDTLELIAPCCDMYNYTFVRLP